MAEHFQRCSELFGVLQLDLSGTLLSQYEVNFLDAGATVLSELEMVSSMNFVRSWMSSNLVSRTRQSMSALLRLCESTDMQVARLHNSERCGMWDQLLKKGLTETYNLCERMLSKETRQVSAITIDGYRSSVYM